MLKNISILGKEKSNHRTMLSFAHVLSRKSGMKKKLFKYMNELQENEREGSQNL